MSCRIAIVVQSCQTEPTHTLDGQQARRKGFPEAGATRSTNAQVVVVDLIQSSQLLWGHIVCLIYAPVPLRLGLWYAIRPQRVCASAQG